LDWIGIGLEYYRNHLQCIIISACPATARTSDLVQQSTIVPDTRFIVFYCIVFSNCYVTL